MTTKNTYSIKQLKDLAKEQGYKFACLYNNTGEKLNNYNTHQVAISKQMDVIEARLKNPILPDGIYFVGMCMKYGSGQVVDKYPIVKGRADISENSTYTIMQPVSKTENVLSYESALEMNKQISKLEYENHVLKENNRLLGEKIASLEKDLKETENSLSEYEDSDGTPKTSPLAEFGEKAKGWLSDIAPILSPIADRYFDLKEKNIALEEKKLDAKRPVEKKQIQQKKLKVGSDEFLEHCRQLHAEGDEDNLNKCLDLLEEHFNDQYITLCEELDLFEKEEEEEEETNNG